MSPVLAMPPPPMPTDHFCQPSFSAIDCWASFGAASTGPRPSGDRLSAKPPHTRLEQSEYFHSLLRRPLLYSALKPWFCVRLKAIVNAWAPALSLPSSKLSTSWVALGSENSSSLLDHSNWLKLKS